MIRIAFMGWRPSPDESFDISRQGRHKLSGRLAKKHGRWSDSWACKQKSWGDHVYRNHDTATWSLSLLQFHGDEWLEQQRASSSGPGESRTNTRACRGKVHRRWHEGYIKVSVELHVCMMFNMFILLLHASPAFFLV